MVPLDKGRILRRLVARVYVTTAQTKVSAAVAYLGAHQGSVRHLLRQARVGLLTSESPICVQANMRRVASSAVRYI